MMLKTNAVVISAMLGLGAQSAHAERYYVFSLNREEVRAFDLDSVREIGDRRTVSGLRVANDKSLSAEGSTFFTTVQSFDCRAKTYQTEYEGENRYDGTVLRNKPLPMGPFRPVSSAFGDERVVAVICGKAPAEPARVVVADPKAIAGVLAALFAKAP